MKNAIHPHTKSVIIVIYLLILITLPYLYIWYVNKTDCVYYPRKQSLRGIRTSLSNKKRFEQKKNIFFAQSVENISTFVRSYYHLCIRENQ